MRSPPRADRSAKSRPPCSSTARRAAARPIPDPRDFVEKDGSKRRGRSASGTPGPSSSHATSRPRPPRRPATARATTSTLPPAVSSASTAFRTKFETASRSSDRSTKTSGKARFRLPVDPHGGVRGEIGSHFGEERREPLPGEKSPFRRRRAREAGEAARPFGQEVHLPEDRRRRHHDPLRVGWRASTGARGGAVRPSGGSASAGS